MIRFSEPTVSGNEIKYLAEAVKSKRLSGDNYFGKKVHTWFKKNTGAKSVLFTPSCTAALEMAAILVDIQPGDEVIMPSYTFVSSANAFVLRGAKIVFVDVRPDTMNINENLIETAITERTKAIVPVHYAGVACEMDVIMDIANRNGLFVIEDAAQGMMASYKGKPLGTIGHFGAYSFHETKNYTSGGEGGLLIVNDDRFIERAEIIREKGTNRSKFFRGMVDKYSWVDIGSSYLPSELQAAYLYGQLESADAINDERLKTWELYNHGLSSLQHDGVLSLPSIPSDCRHNGHIFYLKVSDITERQKLIDFLKEKGINAVFHYIPLHSSDAGVNFSRFNGYDEYTTKESEKLVRLPIWFGITRTQVEYVIDNIIEYFQAHRGH